MWPVSWNEAGVSWKPYLSILNCSTCVCRQRLRILAVLCFPNTLQWVYFLTHTNSLSLPPILFSTFLIHSSECTFFHTLTLCLFLPFSFLLSLYTPVSVLSYTHSLSVSSSHSLFCFPYTLQWVYFLTDTHSLSLPPTLFFHLSFSFCSLFLSIFLYLYLFPLLSPFWFLFRFFFSRFFLSYFFRSFLYFLSVFSFHIFFFFFLILSFCLLFVLLQSAFFLLVICFSSLSSVFLYSYFFKLSYLPRHLVSVFV